MINATVLNITTRALVRCKIVEQTKRESRRMLVRTFDLKAPWHSVLIGRLPAAALVQTVLLPRAGVAAVDALVHVHRTDRGDGGCAKTRRMNRQPLSCTCMSMKLENLAR